MKMKKLLSVGALVGASLAGGALGAHLLGTANAATATQAPNSTTTVQTPNGRWHSNTNPAHEKAESPARAAEEKTADASGVPPKHR